MVKYQIIGCQKKKKYQIILIMFTKIIKKTHVLLNFTYLSVCIVKLHKPL